MFRKIAVAYNESPESQRAFTSAMQLARALDAELSTITVMAHLPAYTAFAAAADPALPRIMDEDRTKYYERLQAQARTLATEHGLSIHTHTVDGPEVEAILVFLRQYRADLLVVGLHQRDLYIARLWSTVYELAQGSPCSVLGVH